MPNRGCSGAHGHTADKTRPSPCDDCRKPYASPYVWPSGMMARESHPDGPPIGWAALVLDVSRRPDEGLKL